VAIFSAGYRCFFFHLSLFSTSCCFFSIFFPSPPSSLCRTRDTLSVPCLAEEWTHPSRPAGGRYEWLFEDDEIRSVISRSAFFPSFFLLCGERPGGADAVYLPFFYVGISEMPKTVFSLRRCSVLSSLFSSLFFSPESADFLLVCDQFGSCPGLSPRMGEKRM